MSSCIVYKDKKVYKIITESINTLGMGIGTFPIHILSKDTAPEALKTAISDCLNSSKTDLDLRPDSDEFAEHSKNILNELREKNYTSIYKSSSGCSIAKKDDDYKLIVYKLFDTRNPRFGFARDYELSFSSMDELIEKLIGL
jgi:hypothetical protein